MNPLMGLAEAAARLADQRDEQLAQEEQAKLDGWEFVDFKRQSLQLKINIANMHPATVLTFCGNASAEEIFLELYPMEFVKQILERRKSKRPNAHIDTDGNARAFKRLVSVATMYQYLACRIWMQGKQGRAGPKN